MTDHLATAQRWLSTAQDSRSFDHLMSAMDQIIAAAEPHIRAKIAAEIEQHYLGADYGRNPTTGADSPDARLHEAYDEALSLAARIARGEQP